MSVRARAYMRSVERLTPITCSTCVALLSIGDQRRPSTRCDGDDDAAISVSVWCADLPCLFAGVRVCVCVDGC